jgi:hypothetical protein
MTRSDLVRTGFRAVRRRPAVMVAEIMWHWSFGVAAGALVTVAGLRFLASLTVTDGELFALRSAIPPLMADAILHIFEGSGPRLLRLVFLLTPAISVLWVLAASAGRAATLRALVEDAPASFTRRHDLRSMLAVNSLRVVVALLALVAMAGSAILAGLAANTTEEPSILLFNVVFLGLLFLVSLSWSTLNWYFSLAPIFVVRDNRSALGAVADAVQLVRRRGGDFSGVSTLYGLLKLFAIGVATVLSLLPLAFVAQWPWEITTVLLVLLTLAYFGVADVLYIARLASYLAIADQERAGSAQPAANSPQPEAAPSASSPGAPAPESGEVADPLRG